MIQSVLSGDGKRVARRAAVPGVRGPGCSRRSKSDPPGTRWQLKAWLSPLKKNEAEPLVRFETPPGQQMQADFTYVRRGRDPLLALVATLCVFRRT